MTTPEAAICSLHFGAVVRNDPLLSLLPQPHHQHHFGQHFDSVGADGSMAAFTRFADGSVAGSGTAPLSSAGSTDKIDATLAAFHHQMNFGSSPSAASYLRQRPPLIPCRNANAGPVRFCILAVDRLFDHSTGDTITKHDRDNDERKIPLSSIEVRVRVELRAYGHLLAPEFITCSTLKGNGEFGENGCWVTFPIGFAEVPVDAVACCTVIASSGDIVGGATFTIFDNSGAVIAGGPWSYPLVKGVCASGSSESSTLVSPMQSRWDTASVLVKSGKLPGTRWMDDAAVSHIKRVQSALSSSKNNNAVSSGQNLNKNSNNTSNSHFSHFWSEAQEVQAVREELAQHQLRLEQEKLNQQQIGEELGLTTSPSLHAVASTPTPLSPEAQKSSALGTTTDHNAGKQHLLLYTSHSPMPVCLRLAFPSVAGNSKAVLVRTSTLQDGSDALQWLTSSATAASVNTLHYPPNPTAYYPFKDSFVNAAATMSLESKIPDEAGLCVKKAAILSRSSNFLYDPNAKPNAEQRRMFDEIAKTPPIQLGSMPENHVALLWQFRHFITREPHLLLPFVKSIDWSDEKERSEAGKIVRKWKQVAVADALLLLSKPFRGVTILREVAVNRLKSENDAQICLLLLQLVQCIRYDDAESLDLFYFLVDRSRNCWSICNFFYWYVRVECDLEEEQRQAALKALQQQKSGKNKQNNQQQQNDINGLTNNNNNNQQNAIKYTEMMKLFISILEKDKPQYKKRMDGQEQLLKVLTKLYTSIALKELDRKARIEKSKKLIDNKECGIAQLFDPQNPVTHGFVFLPSHPHIAVKGVISDGLYLFKSAKQPMLLPFVVEHGENIREHADIVGSGKEKEKTLLQVAETSVKGRAEDQPKFPIGGVENTRSSQGPPGSGNNNNANETLSNDSNIERARARLRAGTFAQMGGGLPSDALEALKNTTSVQDNLEASQMQHARTNSSSASSVVTHNQQQPSTVPPSSSASSARGAAAPASSCSNTNNRNIVDKEKQDAEKIGDVFKIIFKNGDDVRQDQLVIQVVEFADLLLRQNGLQLHLTPYRVLATSPTQGFVECVPEVETLQDVQKQTVNAYLMSCVKDKPNAKDLHRSQQEKFLKSCAGYGVITYLLGVGDRHLENLLVTKDGRLLHIDFGFILGKDPKPLPPPMKLNKEMVEAMGGVEGRDFAAFRVHSFTAYSVLRRHHTLFLALLLLMVDASMPNFDDDGKVDPLVNLRGVQEKLRLDLTDEADVRAFYAKIIQESLSARFTVLWDVIHVMAQNARA